MSPSFRRSRWLSIAAVVSICLATAGCGLAPPSRSPLAQQLDKRLSEDVAKQVQRDPFPSASEIGL